MERKFYRREKVLKEKESEIYRFLFKKKVSHE